MAQKWPVVVGGSLPARAKQIGRLSEWVGAKGRSSVLPSVGLVPLGLLECTCTHKLAKSFAVQDKRQSGSLLTLVLELGRRKGPEEPFSSERETPFLRSGSRGHSTINAV